DTFVSLLKDGRGHVEVSVPVYGRLSSPEFDLGDAIWSALRGLAFKTVGLPFTLIGKLFVSEDSRIESLSVNPVTFLPGTATPRAGRGRASGPARGIRAQKAGHATPSPSRADRRRRGAAEARGPARPPQGAGEQQQRGRPS